MSAAWRIGTAGWSLPREVRAGFPADGTQLERYARVLDAVEINASFYRPIRPALYAKWAAGVPPSFRFAVKAPKTITHERRLLDCEAPLAAFLDEVAGLGDRLGCLLVQLPPSLGFEPSVAGAFLALLRLLHDGPVALEPRHASWFGDDGARLLREYGVARVAADPARVPEAAVPGGASELAYFRLHGSPRVYWSRYDDLWLDALAGRMRAAAERAPLVWCVFDNTAAGAALPNALELLERLRGPAA